MSVFELEIESLRSYHEPQEILAGAISACSQPHKRWQLESWCGHKNIAPETWKPDKVILHQSRAANWAEYSVGSPKTIPAESLNALKFRQLAEQWYRETGMLSMIHKKSMHPAYQRIIGMGKDALPFIFQEMKKNRGHWLWALSAIQGDDVAQPECSLKQAVEAWMKWGEENGYI